MLVGLGLSTTFVPLVSVVSASFARHRSIAVGVAVSGIGLGTLVLAPVIAWLIAGLGWRSAYLVLAVAGGAVMAGVLRRATHGRAARRALHIPTSWAPVLVRSPSGS